MKVTITVFAILFLCLAGFLFWLGNADIDPVQTEVTISVPPAEHIQ